MSNLFCWQTLLKYINFTPWRWPSKGFNKLHLRKLLKKIGDLIIYEGICRCLFDIMILRVEQEYEQDRVAYVITHKAATWGNDILLIVRGLCVMVEGRNYTAYIGIVKFEKVLACSLHSAAASHKTLKTSVILLVVKAVFSVKDQPSICNTEIAPTRSFLCLVEHLRLNTN